MTEVIQVEGDTLEDAVQAAAGALGVEREAVEFKYDRDHLAAGASTVRIFASKKSPEAIAAARAAAAAAPPPSEPRPPREGGRDGGRFRDDRRGGGDRGPGGDRDRGPPRGDRGGDRGPRRRDPVVDAERDERLKERARGVVARVQAGEGPLEMENLNSFERHLVHTIVAEAGLASLSIGEENRKNVRISIKE